MAFSFKKRILPEITMFKY